MRRRVRFTTVRCARCGTPFEAKIQANRTTPDKRFCTKRCDTLSRGRWLPCVICRRPFFSAGMTARYCEACSPAQYRKLARIRARARRDAAPMMTVKCANCGNEFEKPSWSSTRFCTTACSRTVLKKRRCVICGKSFEAFTTKAIYCSEPCGREIWKARARDKSLRLRSGLRCAFCQTLFAGNRRTQRYCTPLCAQRGYRRDNEARVKVRERRYRDTHVAQIMAARRRGRLRWQNLTDSYVQQRLRHGTTLGPEDKFPPEIVEIEREKLRLLRVVRNTKMKGINDP